MAIDFERLAADLLSRGLDLLQTWLPEGRLVGHEYTCASLKGGRGDSCKVNVRTGAWADFSGDAKGGDLISLYAAINGMKQGEAAKALAGDTLPAPVREGKLKHPKYGEPSAYWTYRSAAGQVLGYVARYDPAGQRKEFLPWVGGKCKGFAEPRPLYGLDLLSARPSAPVMLVEGEKACDAARVIAGTVYVVMTWPNGAKAVGKADWTPLSGRKVLIWPDADEPGIKAAYEIAALLAPMCPEVKLLDVDGEAPGSDAADFKGDWNAFKPWAKPRIKLYERPQVVEAAPPPEPQIDMMEDNGEVSGSLYSVWEKLGLSLTSTGSPICNVDNALRVLEGWPKFKNVVWFDEFHNKYFTNNKGNTREWSDVDDLNMLAFMQRVLGIRRISDDMIHKAVVIYAQKNTRNEPRDWIGGLKWDGEPRINEFFYNAFSVTPTPYAEAASRNFWIGLVARVMNPGCKLDTMVILEGPQGAFKSTALNVIGGKWYAELKESVNTNDFFMAFHGKMILEVGELDSFSRGEITRIKQVLSCKVDRFRPPYGRASMDFPRRSILVGTTNERVYLRDHTGARRFWPIFCGQVRPDFIERKRDQLFAEALHCYRAWEKSKRDADGWWEMPKTDTLREQEARRQVDEWEGLIEQWLIGKGETTLPEVAMGSLRVEPAKLDRLTTMRIGSILRMLGWEQHRDSKGKAWRLRDLTTLGD